jgi:hypothetical protein
MRRSARFTEHTRATREPCGPMISQPHAMKTASGPRPLRAMIRSHAARLPSNTARGATGRSSGRHGMSIPPPRLTNSKRISSRADSVARGDLFGLCAGNGRQSLDGCHAGIVPWGLESVRTKNREQTNKATRARATSSHPHSLAKLSGSPTRSARRDAAKTIVLATHHGAGMEGVRPDGVCGERKGLSVLLIAPLAALFIAEPWRWLCGVFLLAGRAAGWSAGRRADTVGGARSGAGLRHGAALAAGAALRPGE